MSRFDKLEELQPGDVVADRFELRKLLGSGGAGLVFEAWESTLRRMVALKLPRSDKAAELLVAEGQALAAFRTEGLPAVHAVETHEGLPVLVIERLLGHTLDQVIARHRDGSMPWLEAVRYLLSIVDTVQLLHRAHLAHRDLKPENIMVCPNGRVVVIDLGILRQERQFVLGSELSGTPDYIAPETIQGQVKPGDAHLVDVYALGVVGYELLTGLLPYPAEELSELFQQILHHPTPRVRAERPEVPYALDVLLASMMAKEQGDRPDSIDAVHYQLSAIAEGRSLDPRGRRLRVVAVDDDDDYLELIRSCTEQLQEEVDLRLANEGPKALELLREDPCDLLIADLDMPQMSGMELFMHVRAMPEARDTLVAIISGTAKPSDRALLTQMGVIDFIEKKGQTFGLLVERFESLVARAAAARAPT